MTEKQSLAHEASCLALLSGSWISHEEIVVMQAAKKVPLKKGSKPKPVSLVKQIADTQEKGKGKEKVTKQGKQQRPLAQKDIAMAERKFASLQDLIDEPVAPKTVS